MRFVILAGLAAFALAPAANAADAAHGKQIFREQCGLCHSAGPGDGEAGQGPPLAGLIGRKVGGDPTFSYTPELKAVATPWTVESLDKFLNDPQAAVPGTAMPISLTDPVERGDVVAYLATAQAGAPAAAAPATPAR
jgi:cytochrome c2